MFYRWTAHAALAEGPPHQFGMSKDSALPSGSHAVKKKKRCSHLIARLFSFLTLNAAAQSNKRMRCSVHPQSETKHLCRFLSLETVIRSSEAVLKGLMLILPEPEGGAGWGVGGAEGSAGGRQMGLVPSAERRDSFFSYQEGRVRGN